MAKSNLFKWLFFSLFLFSTNGLFAQVIDENLEKDAIISTITHFFNGMRKKDTTLINQTLFETVRFQTTGQKEGVPFLHEEMLEDFLTMIATPRKEIFDEQILSFEIRIDGQMATAWTPYKFYLDKTFSHCGVNAFQLFKSESGWKIISILDTRRKEPCD